MNNAHEALSDVLKEINITEFKLSDDLRDDLKLDSIGIVTLMVKIEDKFDIKFDPINDDIPSIFKTVGSVAGFLEENKIHGQ